MPLAELFTRLRLFIRGWAKRQAHESMRHTEETKKKISEGVKRHYETMTPEENETRKERIATFRKRENRLYHYLKQHQDILRRVIEEVKLAPGPETEK